MKVIKIIIILSATTFLFVKTSFSKNIQTNTYDNEFEAILFDFVKVDNALDKILSNPNSKISAEELICAKNDMEKIALKQRAMLIDLKVDKENLKYFKLMKLYSNKIRVKLLKVKKLISQKNTPKYRMSPSNKKSKGKELIILNKNFIEINKSLDEALKASNKVSASSKWLYIANSGKK
ncbi:MAG: hypothetical protein K6357_07395 [Elusimicrobiota bacterium]